MIQDGLFDRLFPRAIRGLSAMHWTPVEVALRGGRPTPEGVIGLLRGAGPQSLEVLAARLGRPD